MRVVLQRVSQAKVEVQNQCVGQIDNGYLLLVGFERDDHEDLIDPMISKILKLKLFANDEGRFSYSLGEVNGSILAVSQFTLFADVKKGKKPSWSKACEPKLAESLYDTFVDKLRDQDQDVETGIFGASMQVYSQNDGPVTIQLDSKELFPHYHS